MSQQDHVRKRIDFMHDQRETEWIVARNLMPIGGKILDYGSGTGIMASLAENDFSFVAGIDIASSNYRSWTVWPVATYDGKTIPFPDNHFDVVLSSHSIYFGDPAKVHSEIARVLLPTGMAVHIVPTASARTLAAGMHFITLPVRIARVIWGKVRSPEQSVVTDSESLAMEGIPSMARRLLPASLTPPSSFVEEILRFRITKWRQTFQSLGWEIVAEAPTYTFGSSRQIFGRFFPRSVRKGFAKLFGSHSHVFVLRPPGSGTGSF